MATAAELTFARAIMAAEGVRQVAKAAAAVTYAFNPANLATYEAALTAADVAYITAVNSAANTLNLAGYTVPNSGPSVGNVGPGNLGQSGVASIGGISSATMGAIG